jgi:alpha-beta hydrolase superfamily lysophospholipase
LDGARRSAAPSSRPLGIFLVLVTLAGAWLAAAGPARGLAAARTVTFRTDDGLTLSAAWHEPAVRPAPAVILVHMLSRSRRDWDGVAARLASDGIGALAIDLRGHGDSPAFAFAPDTPDYTPLVADVAAARRYLGSRSDVLHARIGVLGASLGANLAVLAAAGDAGVSSLALLSPSLDYRGLRIEAALRKYGRRPALLVASDDDPYAGRSVKDLQKAGGGIREAVLLSRAGHGTLMLARDPGLVRTLVDWFRRTL